MAEDPPIRVEDLAGLPAEVFRPLSEAWRGNARSSTPWTRGRTLDPPTAPIESIAQDEFSFDVLFPCHAGLYLAYDTG